MDLKERDLLGAGPGWDAAVVDWFRLGFGQVWACLHR